MAFTAKDVKELREMTGCGMMDCKKALAEADGDMNKAIEFLREKGLAAQQKKAGRIAAEGIVVSVVDGNVGVVLEVNAETDFVAKNEKFVNFANAVAATVIANDPADVDALKAMQIAGGENTVEEALRDLILVIGENMQIRRFERLEGVLVPYVHAQGKIGVMVQFDTDVADNAEFVTLAKDVAMQVAANSPAYTRKEEVPAEVVENEKRIQLATALNEGKPQNIAEKMVMGRMSKYFGEVCLLEQESIKEDKMTVAKVVAAKAKELGGKIEVIKFVRFERGEGMEKREDNFADEVASML